MLVLFYFYERGYTPFEVASLFLFYEVFGIVTNLVGGWLARAPRPQGDAVRWASARRSSRWHARRSHPSAWLVVPYVMAAQALSGIAKDLTKMSSKSAVKLVAPEDAPDALFSWVAILTGSKNALKGVGFFLGGLLLTVVGFQPALLILAGARADGARRRSLALMRGELGRPDSKAKFAQMFSNNRAVNMLAAARVFLFAARDVWFVVGLPVFLHTVLGWSFWQVGGFLAVWVIGYGIVQASRPASLGGVPTARERARRARPPPGWRSRWRPSRRASRSRSTAGVDPTLVVVAGLIAFGVIFALNSAVHSYLILAYTDSDKVAMNVGFYYMANAGGRLAGTVLSGLLYQWQGLEAACGRRRRSCSPPGCSRCCCRDERSQITHMEDACGAVLRR